MTLRIAAIRQKVINEQFDFSKHAVDQSILRQIQVQEVREAIANGEVIEDYPNDKHGPSCLVSGFNPSPLSYSRSMQLPISSPVKDYHLVRA